MNIAIGCDEAGFDLKEKIITYLEKKGHVVTDFGSYKDETVLYPDIGFAVANSISKKENERGILICGTGIGMAISANKVKGIRAGVCHDPLSTERSRKSNDAQIMCLGARIIAPELALYLVELWFGCEFEGGGSTEKVNKISELEGVC